MPAPQSRPIKKPRISLSCIVCRRRKIGCGREKPECANCMRMKEACVYRVMARDESTGRVRPASPSPQNHHYSGSDPHPHSQHRNDPDANAPCERGGTATSRGPLESPEPTAYPSTTSNDPNHPKPTPLCRDYLSLRRGGHVRYIGSTFWGFVAGKVSCALKEEPFHAILRPSSFMRIWYPKQRQKIADPAGCPTGESER